MKKPTKRKEQEPMQKEKRLKTTMNLPERLWKAVRIRSIETGVDAQDIVAQAIDQYLKKGGAR